MLSWGDHRHSTCDSLRTLGFYVSFGRCLCEVLDPIAFTALEAMHPRRRKSTNDLELGALASKSIMIGNLQIKSQSTILCMYM